jgi:hypothetical protein
MFIRPTVRTALGPLVAIAIVAPGIASAQSLFDSQAPATTPTTAAAAPTAKKPAAKKPMAKAAVAKEASKVNVINNREATLIELSLTSMATRDAKPQIVAHDLVGGKKTTATLAKKGGCVYSVNGTFDDQSTVELSALDLCKDNNLNLVE